MLYKLLVHAANKNTANSFLSKIASTGLVRIKEKVKANQGSKSRRTTMYAMYIRWKKKKKMRQRESQETPPWAREIRLISECQENALTCNTKTQFRGHCTITILSVQCIQPPMKMHASITHRDI